MTNVRKVVKIDEEKCNGCGLCIPSCAEGALQLVNGKARLVSEIYCDGLGACLGECPQGAITVEERAAEPFDEEAAKQHAGEAKQEEPLPCGCPSHTVASFEPEEEMEPCGCHHDAPQPSLLGNWPVQLALVPPNAPFLHGADVVLAAHCTAFACGGFHQEFLPGHALLIACPKLDNFPAHLRKLTDILSRADVRSLTVVHMEVPCCSGLVHLVKQAMKASGKEIPLSEVTLGIRGEVQEPVED